MNMKGTCRTSAQHPITLPSFGFAQMLHRQRHGWGECTPGLEDYPRKNSGMMRMTVMTWHSQCSIVFPSVGKYMEIHIAGLIVMEQGLRLTFLHCDQSPSDVAMEPYL